jgi:hypothetical protein
MKRTPEEKLLDPRPGSKIAAAKEFGIDLTLLVSNLRKSPQERIDDLQAGMEFLAELERARLKGPVEENRAK